MNLLLSQIQTRLEIRNQYLYRVLIDTAFSNTQTYYVSSNTVYIKSYPSYLVQYVLYLQINILQGLLSIIKIDPTKYQLLLYSCYRANQIVFIIGNVTRTKYIKISRQCSIYRLTKKSLQTIMCFILISIFLVKLVIVVIVVSLELDKLINQLNTKFFKY